MAVFQLGAIVTKIKGSIGGTAFKTQRATNVMFRKSNGYSRSKLLNNQALQYARYIFTRWGYLNPEVQSGWQNMAAIIFFPDKFGNQVHITGRQLYTKTNINLKRVEYFESISPTFSTVIPILDVEEGVINPVSKYLTLGVEYFDNATAYVEVSAQVSVNNLQSPVYNRRETLLFELITGAALLDLGTAFFAKFPYVTAGYNVRLYVTPVNIYGIKGTPIAVPVNFLDIENGFTLGAYGVALTGNVFQPISTILPVGTVYRSYFQTDEFAMPEPDFAAATFYRSEGYGGQGLLFPLMLLNLAPANLRFGWYVRNWVQAERPDGTFTDPVTAIWQVKPTWIYNFVPTNAIQYENNDIILTIENDFPVGTVFRCKYQVATGAYPTPDEGAAIGFGVEYPLTGDTVDLGDVLFQPPYNLSPTDKIIIWFRPRADNNDIDTAMYLEVEAVEPVLGIDISGAVWVVVPSSGDAVVTPIFNDNVSIATAGSIDFQAAVFFSSWNIGDPLPDPSVIEIDS
jgi:hypothetical protein